MLIHLEERHLNKHDKMWLALAEESASLSNCPRRKIGAWLVDPVLKTPIVHGYNGALRQGPPLCGGTTCLRTTLNIESGTRTEIGCTHAEMNALLHASRLGRPVDGAYCYCSSLPCMGCAKHLYQAGVKTIFAPYASYGTEGIEYIATYMNCYVIIPNLIQE